MTFSGNVYIELTCGSFDITCDTRDTMASQWLHNGCTMASQRESKGNVEAKDIERQWHENGRLRFVKWFENGEEVSHDSTERSRKRARSSDLF
jgi:hypothetical protein